MFLVALDDCFLSFVEDALIAGIVEIVGVVGEATVASVAEGWGGNEGEDGAAIAVADCKVSIRDIKEGEGDGMGEVGVEVT